MRIKFNLSDEITVTNTTVKVSAWIVGVINGDGREKLEARALEAWKRLFPEGKQSFSNFTYQPDGLTFRVQAATRIDATQNENLAERAQELSTQSVKIQIANIDNSIPLHDIRDAEAKLRRQIRELAETEAEQQGGQVRKINFVTNTTSGGAVGKAAMFNATYAQEASAGGPRLGHSEKLSLSATVTIDV